MNLFKNVLKVTMVLAFLFLFGCEKDQISIDNNSLTEEINAVVTKYNDGGEDKIEFPWYPGFQKNEKVVDATLTLKVRQELDKCYSKQTTYLKSAGNTVGVIKDGTCGPYQELYIFMDCEDSGAKSSESGWNGDCWVNTNSSKNVYLFFCVVDNEYFQATNVNYAVLDLSAEAWPSGVSKIRNWMDNENKRNMNACTQGGTMQADGTSTGGTDKKNHWYGNTGVTDNTMLGYYYYPSSSYTSFPSLGGISYGVFGSFGATQGTIFVDNQDGASSWIGKQDWTGYNLGPESFPSSVPGIVSVDGNQNTTMNFSKVN